METIIVKNTLEAEIALAIKSRLEKKFEIRMAVENSHGRELRTTELRGILLGFDAETGMLKIQKTENGLGQILEVPIYEVNLIK